MNGDEALRIHRSILATTGPILKLQPQTIEHLADCSLRLIIGAETPGLASAIAYESAMALYDDVFGSHPVFSEEYRTMQHVIDTSPTIWKSPCPSRIWPMSPASAGRIFRGCLRPTKACRRRNSCCRNG
jgi:hypothetical protein